MSVMCCIYCAAPALHSSKMWLTTRCQRHGNTCLVYPATLTQFLCTGAEPSTVSFLSRKVCYHINTRVLNSTVIIRKTQSPTHELIGERLSGSSGSKGWAKQCIRLNSRATHLNHTVQRTLHTCISGSHANGAHRGSVATTNEHQTDDRILREN